MDRFPLDRFPPEQPAGPASAPPLATYSPSQSSVLPAPPHTLFRSPDEQDPFKISFLKGPKRKRLAKACDACHKSKRRCDGTAPCGNCYFAAKDCTYTDSSGRAVPAPRASGADKPARSGPSQPRRRPQRDAHLESPVPASTNSLSSLHSEPLTSPQDPSDTRDDYAESSKRPRRGSISSFPAPESQAHVPLAPRSTFATTRFEVPVVRELVNLFFAHCHPHRLVIHQPTFMADVTLGRVPSYLLYAMCALAAPFSKHPAVRAESPRTAGSAYSKAAEEQMFDMNGRLNVERSLMTAQALCLLESHQFLLSFPWPSPSSNHRARITDLALSILKEDLNVQEESQSGLSSAPTTSFVLDAIGRECARRAFWYIKLMHLTTFAYYRMPALPSSMDLALRLPVDEASFEFGVHNSQSEFLHLPAPRTQYASEYGHLLRIASVHGHLEGVLAAADGGSSTHDAVMAVVEDTEKAISAWETSLADHVRFSEESTALHLAMFETSSNAGAWCYFMMHTVYAWCLLTLSEAKARGSGIVVNDCREWARDRLVLIGTKLGGRSKNSVLLVAILTVSGLRDPAANLGIHGCGRFRL
ncbi:fungal-specific transcription factor domain-containing protein [Gloeopeniophorella convolvens]|nr:fungal-specific transcription factor domain-containing protein [Gloeopeniophorella convolvens]